MATEASLATAEIAVESGERRSLQPDSTGEGSRSGRGWWPGAVCLGLYLVFTLLEFGLFSSLGPSHTISDIEPDQIQQIWFLEWAQYALFHGHNLFFTNWQNYPVGYNAGVNTSMLGLGILFSPITTWFGPLVTWNVLLRMAVLVSSMSMCLVLRRWTMWWPAAFVGGLLYGFSAYAIDYGGGYLFLVFVPLPPLIFLILYEILVRQHWRPARTGVLLGVACGAQFLISSEILTSSLLMGVFACALYLFVNRKTLDSKWPYIKIASIYSLIVGSLLLGFPVLFTLFGPGHIKGVPASPASLSVYHGDLLGPFVPDFIQRFSTPQLNTFSSRLSDSGSMYLGVPLCVAIGLVVFLLRKRGIVLVAGVMMAIAFILSLGSVLFVSGHDTGIPLPFDVLNHLPLTDGFWAVRLSLYTSLFGAAIVAIGIDVLYWRVKQSHYLKQVSSLSRGIFATGVSIAVVLIVALPLLPKGAQPASSTSTPSFFSSHAASGIREGSVVLAYPYPTGPIPKDYQPQPIEDVVLDQAVAGMHFKLVGGYGWRPRRKAYGAFRPTSLKPLSVEALFNASFYGHATALETKELATSDLTADLRLFMHKFRVDTVIVLPLGHYPARVVNMVTTAIGPPSRTDGVTVWLHVQRRLASLSS